MLILSFCVITQTVASRGICQEPYETDVKKLLWVVDSVALNDSVFDYTLEQMRSDSAAILVCRALKPIHLSDIQNISVIDSIEVSDSGFTSYGEVYISTSYREPLNLIVNGVLYKSKATLTAGDVLGETDRIHQIIDEEFKDLLESDISYIYILKSWTIGIHPNRSPIVVVRTDLPFYRISDFVGMYLGKNGKQTYELTLSADSTYELKKRNATQKSISQDSYNCGTWCLDNKKIVLVSGQTSSSADESNYLSVDTIYLTIKYDQKSLILPRKTWDNKNTVTLRQPKKKHQ